MTVADWTGEHGTACFVVIVALGCLFFGWMTRRDD
jgi:hypothetical protein